MNGAVNIPLNDLRRRRTEVPLDQEVWSYCFVGQRSYYAARALSQYGYNIKSVGGGYKTYTDKRGGISKGREQRA